MNRLILLHKVFLLTGIFWARTLKSTTYFSLVLSKKKKSDLFFFKGAMKKSSAQHNNTGVQTERTTHSSTQHRQWRRIKHSSCQQSFESRPFVLRWFCLLVTPEQLWHRVKPSEPSMVSFTDIISINYFFLLIWVHKTLKLSRQFSVMHYFYFNIIPLNKTCAFSVLLCSSRPGVGKLS